MILFVAAAVRLFLVLNLPIQFLPFAGHDDGLFMRLASNLASGNWLGEYNQYTLMKGPGYPLFLAVTSLSGLPLSASDDLFQTLAISITAWAAFRLTGSRTIAAVVFMALLFCPVGLILQQRVTREQIYWAQTLLVFSLFATISLAPPRGRSAAIIVAGVTGLIFGWAWLTREEGIWFLPGLGLLAAGAVLIAYKNSGELVALARNLGVASIAFVAVNTAFMTGNLIAYGYFIGVDIKEHNFTAALGALQDVDTGSVTPYVPVSWAARSEVARISPAFVPLSVALAPGGPLAGWTTLGCQVYKQTCGDFAGGWFMWAFRDAAAMQGFYKSPKAATENFATIANEITAACSDGRLHCHRRWVRYMPRMTNQQWASLPRTLVAGVEIIARPPLASMATWSSSMSVISGDFARYWTFLNNPRVRTGDPSGKTVVLGWYYDSQSMQWPEFKTYAEDGREVPFSVTRQASPDLQQHFSDNRAGNNRFKVMLRCPDNCAITALTSHGAELRIVLDEHQPRSVTSGSAQLYIDSLSVPATGLVNPSEKFADHVRLNLIRLYNGLLPLLLIAGLIAAAAQSWRAVRARVLQATLLTALAAWALVATRIVILSLIDVGSFPAINVGYSAPANYLAIVAACLSIAALSAKPRSA